MSKITSVVLLSCMLAVGANAEGTERIRVAMPEPSASLELVVACLGVGLLGIVLRRKVTR